jgi:hypothetical protein
MPLPRQIAHDLIVALFADVADVTQQFGHRVLGDAGHSHGGPN